MVLPQRSEHLWYIYYDTSSWQEKKNYVIFGIGYMHRNVHPKWDMSSEVPWLFCLNFHWV